MTIGFAARIDQLPLYADPIPGPVRSSRAATGRPTCDPNLSGPYCAEDCKTLMICLGSTTPEYLSSCPKYADNAPYCVGGRCTASPNMTDPNCKSNFKCTSDGTFPGKDKLTKCIPLLQLLIENRSQTPTTVQHSIIART